MPNKVCSQYYCNSCGLWTHGLTNLRTHRLTLKNKFYGQNALFFADKLHVQRLSNKPGTAAGIVHFH